MAEHGYLLQSGQNGIIRFFFFVVLCLISVVWCDFRPSLAITMICRDEEVNFRANLAAWTPVVDYFVFMIDIRTKDNSIATISSILKPMNKDFRVVVYNFTGFGPARTLSLEATWKHFPQATHVLIADPDWAPDITTMNINDLDNSADVFRFTTYDRNGYTRRRMDWLLKHRQGLAMKYHLHEVLDIGMYTVKNIKWEAHELEKPGSWHTTVGHADSFSAKRYEFDLDLLYKDLALYGHDPHGHYYLGITHDAYASKVSQQLGLHHPEVQRHVNKSIEYLQARATSVYDDEFIDQRWAVMLQLGTVYTHMRRNDLKAIYWLSMCRDYNPRQSECSLSLCQLYINLGQLDPALRELYAVLRQDPEVRAMVEYLNHWECKVPATVVQLFSIKARSSGLSSEEAMYFFLLWRMAQQDRCGPEDISVDATLAATLNRAVGGPQHIDHFATEAEAEVDFCLDPALQQYLLRMEFNTHPCSAVRQSQVFAKQCAIFTTALPPAYEEFQLGTSSKQFVGAAIIPDIIHHSYQGRREDFLGRGEVLRFLFAEHFNPLMVHNLIGQLQSLAVSAVEVVVLTADVTVIQAIQQRLKQCATQVSQAFVEKVQFHLGTAEGYREQFPDKKFQYIEYNGGLSKAADPAQDLVHLSALLSDDGVIGATFFSENHLTTRIHEIVDARNVTASIPFSLEATRLVHSFLDQQKLGTFKTDAELVTHLGGEVPDPSHILYHASHLRPRVQWRSYSQQQATDLLAAAGFRIASWVPSAYAHPFEEIDHYVVQKFRDLGLSQEDYVREMMPNFRYSVYLTKSSLPAHLHGRLRISEGMFQAAQFSRSPASRVHVMDRLNYLSSSFRSMEALAQQRQSTSIEFAHYALPGDTRFGFIVSPVIAPCLPHLSSRPSVQGLHDMNKQFAAREKREFNEIEAQDLLLAFLDYLEKLNIIAYKSTGLSGGDVQDMATFSTKVGSGNLAGARGGSPTGPEAAGQQTRKVGGLKVTNRSKDATASSKAPVITTSPSDKTKWRKDENTQLLKEAGLPSEQIELLLTSEEERFQALSKQDPNRREEKHSGGVVDVLKAYTKDIGG